MLLALESPLEISQLKSFQITFFGALGSSDPPGVCPLSCSPSLWLTQLYFFTVLCNGITCKFWLRKKRILLLKIVRQWLYPLILPVIIVGTHDVKKLHRENTVLEVEPGTNVLSTQVGLFSSTEFMETVLVWKCL